MMKWLLNAAIVLSACFALAPPAGASCAQPEIYRLWSYPAPGATDVPINAELWVLTSGWTAPHLATLDGREVEVSAVSAGGIHITPGPLEPDHAYTLRLEYASAGFPDPTVIEIAFTTAGSDLLATASDAIALQISARPGTPRDQICSSEIAAQDCFDQGQNTLVHLTVAARNPEAWLVEGGGVQVLWPDSCGTPALFTHPPVEGECYEVRAIAVGGLPSEPTRRCYEAASDPYANPRGALGEDDAGTPETTPIADAGAADVGSGADDAGAALDTPGAAMPRRGDRGQGCRMTGVVDANSAWTWLLAAAPWLRKRSARRSRS